jgi:UDP-N-acetylmuramoylalanine--D-glutamate ligase
MELKEKKVLVIGMGRSGLAAVDLLHRKGARVTACDINKNDKTIEKTREFVQKGIEVLLGDYPLVTRKRFDLLVVSPGVPLQIKPIREAYSEMIPVIGEVELAYRFKPEGVSILAITGTNGKTTTTTLLQNILEKGGEKAVSGGNIGIALSSLIDQMDEGYISTEMSSFQLDTIVDFRPHISGIINITPDHIDRHFNMEKYIRAKARVFANQTGDDFTVLNYEDAITRELGKECRSQVYYFSTDRVLNKGAFVKDGVITIITSAGIHKICRVNEVLLRGKHNLENVLCATMMAILAGVDEKSIRESLMTFPGVRHRLEQVACYNQIFYINDSKATNPESAIKALESFSQPIVLIAGGRNKGCDFTDLARIIKERVKEIVLVGEARSELKEAVMDAGFKNINEVEDFPAAVSTAHSLASPGDIVLLAPACTSWDMFESYEQRGDLFCNLVHSLIEQNNKG